LLEPVASFFFDKGKNTKVILRRHECILSGIYCEAVYAGAENLSPGWHAGIRYCFLDVAIKSYRNLDSKPSVSKNQDSAKGIDRVELAIGRPEKSGASRLAECLRFIMAILRGPV
jgi:hypothetical protein